MPLTMPGSAIGSTMRNEIELRPKNLKRCTARLAMVPSTRAMAVAKSPTLTEVHRASRTPWLCNAVSHQWRVYPSGGHTRLPALLSDSTAMSAIGT